MYLLVSFRVQEGFGAKRREFVLQIAATATFPLIIPNALAENGENSCLCFSRTFSFWVLKDCT
jgi:hypothetical protein